MPETKLAKKEKSYSEDTPYIEDKKVLLGVASSTELIDIIVDTIDNPDKILRSKSLGIEGYYDLLYDAHIASCVQSRKSGLLSLEWDIDRELDETKETKFIKYVFSTLNIRNIMNEMLDGVLYGYKPMEIYFKEVSTIELEKETWQGDYLLPLAVIGKPPHWFEFDKDGLMRLSQGLNTEALNSKKFIVIKYNETGNNPYGRGILTHCYWPYVYKKGVTEFWTKHCENHGSPHLWAKMLGNYSQDDVNKINELLNGIIQSGHGVTMEDVDISVLDATGASSTAGFKEIIHYLNSEISKAILSQTLTTEQGETGSYSMSQTHLQVRKDVIDSDKKLIENYLNDFIKLLIELNFIEYERFPTFKLYQEDEINTPLVEMTVKLLSTKSIKFTEKHYEKLNLKRDEFEIIEPPQETTPPGFFEFKESKQNDALRLMYEAAQRQLTESTKKMMLPVLKKIEKAKTYEEVENLILDAYPLLNTEDVQKVIESINFVADAGGQLNKI